MELIQADRVKVGDFIKKTEADRYQEVMAVEEKGNIVRLYLKCLGGLDKEYMDIPYHVELIKKG